MNHFSLVPLVLLFEVDSLSALENNYVPKKSFIHDSAVIQLAENKLDSPTPVLLLFAQLASLPSSP